MRKLLSAAAIAAMVFLAWGADGPVPAKKNPAKKTASKPVASTKKPASTASAVSSTKKPAASSRTSAASRRAGKKAPPSRVTWRNRQLAPTPDRYKEIQGALVAKGYLKPEDISGAWNQASMDALKRFQSEQNLEATGKINSLSLIALGLGPKHETPAMPPKPPSEPGQQQAAAGQSR